MAAGDPVGPALATVIVDANTLDTSTETTFTFNTPYSLVDGKQYAIVVETNSILVGEKLNWSQDTAAGYSGGLKCISDDDEASWTQVAIRDCFFTCYSGVGETDSFTSGTPSLQAVYDPYIVAQTFTAGSNYPITSVKLPLTKSVGVVTGTVTVSIYAVVGESYPTLPTKATTPAPTDAATTVTLDQSTITWVDGGDTDTFNVYYGTESGNLSLVQSDLDVGTPTFTINGITNGSPFDYIQTRYWRIDSVNSNGTTTGDEWSFTTIRFAPPSVPHWYAAGEFWYILYEGGDPPPTGTENVDYEIVSFSANFIRTNRKLVAAAGNAFYYEAI